MESIIEGRLIKHEMLLFEMSKYVISSCKTGKLDREFELQMSVFKELGRFGSWLRLLPLKFK